MTSCRDWRYVIGAVILIALAAMINYEVRHNQWQYWQDHQDVFFADQSPLVSWVVGFATRHPRWSADHSHHGGSA
jgi:hypothetical protein